MCECVYKGYYFTIKHGEHAEIARVCTCVYVCVYVCACMISNTGYFNTVKRDGFADIACVCMLVHVSVCVCTCVRVWFPTKGTTTL